MYDDAVARNPYRLRLIPDHLKMEEMCIEAVRREPNSLEHVPDRLKTQEMCNEALIHNRYMLRFIPDHLKTQEMCDTAVRMDSGTINVMTQRIITSFDFDAIPFYSRSS